MRYFRVPIGRQDRPADAAGVAHNYCEYIEFRITYEHRLCRNGKQLGPLLYTVTLLPGEKVTLYHSERFAQITSTQDRYSVETTFAQFLSKLHQARVTSDPFGGNPAEIGSGSAASIGGLAGVFGPPERATKFDTGVSDPNSLNVNLVSDQFSQSVTQASRMTNAERSVVISTYVEADVQNVTARTLQNENACRAVTYFVRKVLEHYSLTTIVTERSFRIVDCRIVSDWYPINDHLSAADAKASLPPSIPSSLPPDVQKQVRENLPLLPKVGTIVEREKPIYLPTDGTVYDPELAHCSSCEPERQKATELQLQLLEVELERRQQLLLLGKLDPFEPARSEPPPPCP
jgi:thermitase